ncbi:hypothetical protein DV736_g883, partial [Chaetothyriales sp. CBS 134916]
MSDDEADPELVALLRQSLGLEPSSGSAPPETRVLRAAEFIYDNAVDVSISSAATKAAAATLWKLMKERDISTHSWAQHELHPAAKNEATVNFIFTIDLLNFSFWSDRAEGQRAAIEYRGRRWTGYWSLVAALQRALDEGYPITTPSFYASEDQCPDLILAHIFRSCTAEPFPLLAQRIRILRSAGAFFSQPDSSPAALVKQAHHSAARLVNLLVEKLPGCFNDAHTFQGKEVVLHKRAQILVADLWACFTGQSYGQFDDIGALTMFADYRVPQMLHSLGCLWYSPRLEGRIKRGELLESGETAELEIRGCSVWCVQVIKREIETRFAEELRVWKTEGDGREVNAVLIDYLLYDLATERQRRNEEAEKNKAAGKIDEKENGLVNGEQAERHGLALPHHRTRSIWY